METQIRKAWKDKEWNNLDPELQIEMQYTIVYIKLYSAVSVLKLPSWCNYLWHLKIQKRMFSVLEMEIQISWCFSGWLIQRHHYLSCEQPSEHYRVHSWASGWAHFVLNCLSWRLPSIWNKTHLYNFIFFKVICFSKDPFPKECGPES